MKQKSYKKRGLNIFGLFILFGIFLINFVSAVSCDLEVSLVNQDPYPAIPNDYLDVVFQVTGLTSSCGGAWMELDVSYPFSFDEGEGLKFLEGGSTWASGYKKEWVVPYTLRVDKDALDGVSEIEIHYSSGEPDSDSYFIKKFNITVQDSRTDFDVVIQESTSSEVSLAIANVGKYAANSVVVRIPEQENFKASETDGQMVGNLDAGDYTIVSFSLTSTFQRNMQAPDSNEGSEPNFQTQKNNLQFDIYYTDALGVRRIVNMELPLQLTSSTFTEGEMPEGFVGRNGRNTSSWSIWYTLAIILILAGIIFFLCKKYPEQTKEFFNKLKQKIKKLFNKKKKSNDNSSTTPDWIKSVRKIETKK